MEIIHDSKYLTVSFSGSSSPSRFWITFGSLDLGAPFGLKYVNSRGDSGLFFIPKEAIWYQHDDIWQAISRAMPFIDRSVPVVSYGSSMGGFAALAFSEEFAPDLVIVAAPQCSISPDVVGDFDTRWADVAARLRFQKPDARIGLKENQSVKIIFDPLQREDRLNVDLIAKRCAAQLVAFPGAGHGVLHTLSDHGLLTQLVDALASGQDESVQLVKSRYRIKKKQGFEIWYVLADLAMNKGEFRRALRMFSEALLRAPSFHESYHGLADCLWNLGYRAAAIEADRKSVELMPMVGGHWVRLGLRLVESGRPAEALAVFEAGLKVLPEAGGLFNGCSIALRAMDRLEEALAPLEAAVAREPSATAWQLDLAHLKQALALEPAGDQARDHAG